MSEATTAAGTNQANGSARAEVTRSRPGRKGRKVGGRGVQRGKARRLVEPLEPRLLLANQPLDTALTNFFTVQTVDNALTSTLNSLGTSIGSGLSGVTVPIVGSKLPDTTHFITDPTTGLTAKLIAKLNSFTSPESLASALNTAFAGINSNGLQLIANVTPQFFEGTAGTTKITNGTDPATNVLFDIDLTGSFTYGGSVPLDLGLPAVSLSATNFTPTVTVSYTAFLHVGVIDKGGTGQLYIDTNPSDTTYDTTGDQANLVKANVPAGTTSAVNFTAHLGLEAAGSTTPATFTGTFGPLTLSAQDMLSTSSTLLTNPNTHQKITDATNPGTKEGNITASGFDLKAGVIFGSSVTGDNGLLYFNNLSALQVKSLTIGGVANVDLFMLLTFQGNTSYPSIAADLELNWAFGSDAQGDAAPLTGTGAAMSQTPTLSLNDVSLGVGSFLGGFAKTAIEDVGAVLKPLAPLIHVLNDAAPIFNDISFLRKTFDQNNDGTATVAEVLGQLSGYTSLGSWANQIGEILNLVNEVGNFTATAGATDVYLDFGDLTIGQGATGGTDLRNSANLLSNLTNLSSQASVPNDNVSTLQTNFTNALGSVGTYSNLDYGISGATLANTNVGADVFGNGPASNGSSASGTTPAGFSFPILSNPTSLFQLVLGQKNVPLFTYVSPALNFSGGSLGLTFPIIGPLAGVIKGANNGNLITVQGQIGVGYDTYGLLKLANDEKAGSVSPGQVVSDLADGFYINTNQTFLTFTIGIAVGAELDLIFAQLGVDGDLSATISLHLTAPSDGSGQANSLRPALLPNGDPTNLINDIQVNAVVTAGLQAFIKIGIGPFSWEQDFTLASITLLHFQFGGSGGGGYDPDSPVPVVGGVIGHTLTLNTGAGTTYASNNVITIDDVHSDPYTNLETVKVSLAHGPNDYAPTVATFQNVSQIDVNGGGGNNVIVIDPGVTSAILANGGYDSSAAATLQATEGNDIISDSGTGVFTLNGGIGNDTISVGNGNYNALHADGGVITGGSGDDTINVTTDTQETVNINGGAGNDHIFVGGLVHAATITDPSGNNIIDSAAYQTTWTGGTGSDQFIAHQEIGDGSIGAIFSNTHYPTSSYALTPGTGVESLVVEGINDQVNQYTLSAVTVNGKPTVQVVDQYANGTAAESDTFSAAGFTSLDIEGGKEDDGVAREDQVAVGDLTGVTTGVSIDAFRSSNGVSAGTDVTVTAPANSLETELAGASGTLQTGPTSSNPELTETASLQAVYFSTGNVQIGPTIYSAIGTGVGTGDVLTVNVPAIAGGFLYVNETANPGAVQVNFAQATKPVAELVQVAALDDVVEVSTGGNNLNVTDVVGTGIGQLDLNDSVTYVKGGPAFPSGSVNLTVQANAASTNSISTTLTDGNLSVGGETNFFWPYPLTSLTDDLNAAGESITDTIVGTAFPIFLDATGSGSIYVDAEDSTAPIQFVGASGPDTVYGTGVGDFIGGGSANDTIYESDDAGHLGVPDVGDTINGNGGNDYINLTDGDELVNGGAGNDTIVYTGDGYNGQQPTLSGGAGADTITVYGGTPTIYTDNYGGTSSSTDGNDTVQGTAAAATIYGGGGTDTFALGYGSTTVPGGTSPIPNAFGPTTVYFGTGRALLYVGPGGVTTYNGTYADELEGVTAAATAPLPVTVATGSLTDDINTTVTGFGDNFADVNLYTGTQLTLTGPETIGSLTGTGLVQTTDYILTTGVDNATTRFLGVITGTGALVKAGTGSFSLGNANTFTGSTTVSAGTLLLVPSPTPILPTPAVLYTFNNSADTGFTVTNSGTQANANATLLNASEVSGVAGAPGGGNVMSLFANNGSLQTNLVNNKGVDLSGGAWTAGLWFNNLFLSNSSGYLNAFHANSNGDAQALVTTSGKTLGTYVSGSAYLPYKVDGSGTPPVSVTSGWHQLVAVGSGGSAGGFGATGTTTFYIDGSPVGTVAGASASDIDIFGDAASGAQAFAQYLADIDVYKVALTAAQVQSLYQIQGNTVPVGTLASKTITVAAGAALNVNDNTGLLSTATLSSAGTTTFAANLGTGILSRTLASISIPAGGTVAVVSTTSANRTLLNTATVTISGKLDLGDNDMRITGQTIATINPLVASGLNLGGSIWNGNGIDSTSAAGNTAHTTALGVVQNNQSGTPLFSASHQFDGITPAATDVLIKYTYVGDSNLDGRVDGSDYTLIDNAFNKAKSAAPPAGWVNGDFNYDGVVDGSDYTLIDNAFNTQASPLAQITAAVAASNQLSLFSTKRIALDERKAVDAPPQQLAVSIPTDDQRHRKHVETFSNTSEKILEN
jgi:autotransporter-associated beta strand protein